MTTYKRHFNAFGERQFIDFRVGPNRSVATIVDEITAGGAFVSINHPAIPGDESCMGCAWEGFDAETMRRMNALEIVNGNSSEGPLAAWPLWAQMLNSGFHLTAIGGSDEHTADETRDHAIGVPPTVVYAEELSEAALIDGLRKGYVYVRTRGPGGPILQFEAISRGLRWKMGDTVPSSVGNLTLSIMVSRAPGQQVQWCATAKSS